MADELITSTRMGLRLWVADQLENGGTWGWVAAKLIKLVMEGSLSFVCGFGSAFVLVEFTPVAELRQALGVETVPALAIPLSLALFHQVFNCTFEKDLEN